MKTAYLMVILGAASLASFNAFAADAAKPATNSHAAAAESQQEITYADLGKYVGKRVTVYSRLGTTHSGTVTKASLSELFMKVDGDVEMSFPVDSIKRLTVPVAPPEPLFQQPADSKPSDASAKKK